MRREVAKATVLIGVSFALLLGSALATNAAQPPTEKSVVAPRFDVDPFWPKPLPNHWVVGNVVGVGIDAQDNVWIVHRAPTLEPMETYAAANPRAAECCVPAPPVLAFDKAGNLIHAWGGPGDGYDWPVAMHGITVDPDGNIWIGGNGRAPSSAALPGAAPAVGESGGAGKPPFKDNMILKFTQDGKFLQQIGKAGQSKGNNDVDNLNAPAKIWFDTAANEMYVADGYGNSRVIVFDSKTAAYKRHWGAYGAKPEDAPPGPYTPGGPPPKLFRTVHCAVVSADNIVYVCDRVNDRIQVFKTDGQFLKEQFLYPDTLGNGSVWDIAFSADPEQTYLYVADGSNEKIHILNRETLEELTNFGDGGRQPGQFYAVHSIATDSHGNIYTTETYRGQRVQKFVYRGIEPVSRKEQGVVWPATAKSPQ